MSGRKHERHSFPPPLPLKRKAPRFSWKGVNACRTRKASQMNVYSVTSHAASKSLLRSRTPRQFFIISSFFLFPGVRCSSYCAYFALSLPVNRNLELRILKSSMFSSDILVKYCRGRNQIKHCDFWCDLGVWTSASYFYGQFPVLLHLACASFWCDNDNKVDWKFSIESGQCDR